MSGSPKRILVCAGLEPMGRSGLWADLSTLWQLGARTVGIATALTAQGQRVFKMEPASARLISRQLEAALSQGPFDSVKLGMVPDRAVLNVIWRAVRSLRIPIVVDPVVRTSEGKILSHLRPKDYLALASPNVVLTPNLQEAAWLVGARKHESSVAWAMEAAHALAQTGFGVVIVKGGHGNRGTDDVLATRDGVTLVAGRKRARTAAHRGTGCRLASALAFQTAMGATPVQALERAKGCVERYLQGPER